MGCIVTMQTRGVSTPLNAPLLAQLSLRASIVILSAAKNLKRRAAHRLRLIRRLVYTERSECAPHNDMLVPILNALSLLQPVTYVFQHSLAIVSRHFDQLDLRVALDFVRPGVGRQHDGAQDFLVAIDYLAHRRTEIV